MTDPTPVAEPTAVTDLGYAEALAELEVILDRLEHDEPDVDRVAADVERAAALVTHCRSRIADARLKVEHVVGDLDPEASPGTSPDDGSDDDF